MHWLKFKKIFSLLATLISLFFCLAIPLSLPAHQFAYFVLVLLYPLALGIIIFIGRDKSLLYLERYTGEKRYVFLFLFTLLLIFSTWFLIGDKMFLAVSNLAFWTLIYKAKLYASNHIVLRTEELGILRYGPYILILRFFKSADFADYINYSLLYKSEPKVQRSYLRLQAKLFSYNSLEIDNSFELLFKPCVRRGYYCMEFIFLPFLKKINFLNKLAF